MVTIYTFSLFYIYKKIQHEWNDPHRYSNHDLRFSPSVPGPPENLTLLRVHDRSVDLQWSQPSEPNGEIRGYRVYYMQGNYTSVRTVHANEPNILYSLHDLSEYPVAMLGLVWEKGGRGEGHCWMWGSGNESYILSFFPS